MTVEQSSASSSSTPSLSDRQLSDSRPVSGAMITPTANEVIGRLDRLWNEEKKVESHFLSSFKGVEFGHFRIEDEIGSGAFGVVYRALDLQTGRTVALKIPRPENLRNASNLLRFENEVIAAARLEHSSISAIYSVDLSCTTPYIASALCSGPDLGEWIDRNKGSKHDPLAVARFTLELVRAVEYAHGKGLVHRDIKPTNILLVPLEGIDRVSPSLDQYVPKLTDFGMTMSAVSPMIDTRGSIVIGSPMYMSPEQFLPSWGPVDERTDIYSLGVIMYELLEGSPQRNGQTFAQVISSLEQRTSSPLKWTENHVPKELRWVIEKCLETNPRDRYASASDLATDIASVLLGHRILANQSSLQSKFCRWIGCFDTDKWIAHFILPYHVLTLVGSLLTGLFTVIARDETFSRSEPIGQFILPALAYNMIVAAFAVTRLMGQKWAVWGLALWIVPFSILLPILSLTGIELGAPKSLNIIAPQSPYRCIENLVFGIAQIPIVALILFANRREGDSKWR